MHNQEFYIGWMERAPSSIFRFIRRYVLFLLLSVIVLALLLSANQKRFSNAQFEFGKLTTVKGWYRSYPVPHLLVNDGRENVFVPLVGYGKHGAEGIMKELEREKQLSLNNKEVSLKGTLIHGDGKILMQVDKNDNPLISVGSLEHIVVDEPKLCGNQSLVGEVVDPKCYFGVMKPGEGKVHKDCAIRCIAGGIPPVLSIQNEKGERNYLLLIGPNGEKMNDQVKDFVAVPSRFVGKVYQYNNWMIMQVDSMRNNIASVAF